MFLENVWEGGACSRKDGGGMVVVERFQSIFLRARVRGFPKQTIDLRSFEAGLYPLRSPACLGGLPPHSRAGEPQSSDSD